MASNEIKYVDKGSDDHDHITRLGNDDRTWMRDDVIRRIELGIDTFYTYEAGKFAVLVVRQGAYRKYVQTFADNSFANNLLSLPSCRASACAVAPL